MSKIYTITTLNHALGKKRTIGFFHDFDKATDVIINNIGDIHENIYRYVVIEEVTPGIYTFPRNEYWFEWDIYAKTYKSCEKPQSCHAIQGWSMG